MLQAHEQCKHISNGILLSNKYLHKNLLFQLTDKKALSKIRLMKALHLFFFCFPSSRQFYFNTHH